MKRLIALLIPVAFLTLTAASAAAQSPEVSAEPSPEAKVATVTSYDYEADEILGDFDKPLASVINGEVRERLPSLIQTRASFHDLLILSAEAL